MTQAEALATWKAECAEFRTAILEGERPTFVARAMLDGDFWYIEVEGVPRYGDSPGAFTQIAVDR